MGWDLCSVVNSRSGKQCALPREPGTDRCEFHLHGAPCGAHTEDGPCQFRIEPGKKCPEHNPLAALERARARWEELEKKVPRGLRGEAKRRWKSEEMHRRERAALTRIKPTRRQEKHAYRGVPTWWGERHYADHSRAIYAREKDFLVKECGVPTVAPPTFGAYIDTVASHADSGNGRNMRVCRETIAEEMAQRLGRAKPFAVDMVTKCRRIARNLGLLTVICEGAERNRVERRSAWLKQDPSHGWAPLIALHPSKTHEWPALEPVDKNNDDLGITEKKQTYPRSGNPLKEPPFREVVPYYKSCRERQWIKDGAPRRSSEEGGSSEIRRAPVFAGVTVALVAELKADPEIDAMFRAEPDRKLWAALDVYAKHGWVCSDVKAGIRFFRRNKKNIWWERPYHPAMYLHEVLKKSGIRLEGPPSRTAHLKDTGPSVDEILAESRRTRERLDARLGGNAPQIDAAAPSVEGRVIRRGSAENPAAPRTGLAQRPVAGFGEPVRGADPGPMLRARATEGPSGPQKRKFAGAPPPEWDAPEPREESEERELDPQLARKWLDVIRGQFRDKGKGE